jgi:DNA-binding MarR family transcriptional regulator
MAKQSSTAIRQEDWGAVHPNLPERLTKPLSGKEWRRDLLMSSLFQTCMRLQISLDRCFLRYGLTMQEASAVLRCIEVRSITPGQLAIALGRDKGQITRIVDRLEVGGLVTRDVDWRDRRRSLIKPTRKAKQIAEVLAYAFHSVRKQVFVGIVENDVRCLEGLLVQLRKNVIRIATQKRDSVQQRRRSGIHEGKT